MANACGCDRTTNILCVVHEELGEYAVSNRQLDRNED